MDHWACRSPILSQLLVSSWANLINPRGTGGVGGGRGLRQRLRVLVKCAGSNAYVVKATEPQLWGVLFDSKLLFIPQTLLCPLTTSFLGWLETSEEWDLYFTRSPRKSSRPLLIIKDSQTLLISKLFWGAPWISTSALLSIQAASPKGWEQAGWHALGQKQPWNIYRLWNYRFPDWASSSPSHKWDVLHQSSHWTEQGRVTHGGDAGLVNLMLYQLHVFSLCCSHSM